MNIIPWIGSDYLTDVFWLHFFDWPGWPQIDKDSINLSKYKDIMKIVIIIHSIQFNQK